jgi:2-keto-4-pentenoate hydratase/2-oxohepta-3-ene-1,7-dioic acid hydratase in catechol pathway
VRLVRFGERGRERPGLVDGSQVVRDVSELVHDWVPELLTPEHLARIAALDLRDFPAVSAHTRLGVPLKGVGKLIGIGMNYRDFAEHGKRPIPAEPSLFTKAISCLTGPDDEVILPRGSTRTDWEVELGVVVGRTARYVDKARALDHVAGYCLVNDLSEREFQNDRGGTWDKGKGCDTFGPVGPWLVTKDEIRDPQDVDLWLEVNGTRYQNGHTRNMIFSVMDLVSYVSGFMTLEPGDILTTGTPAGVGAALEPPVFLAAGDVMLLGSGKLGRQRHRVTAFRSL